MNFADITAPDQTDAISFEFDLPHSPEKIWRAITDPALLEQWLLPVFGFELTPGASFTFKTQPYPGWDGTVDCRVLDVEPLRKLSYAWVVGDALDTVVTFTLTPTPAGTRLTLVQSGFRPDQKQNFGGARYGWKMMGGKLVNLLGESLMNWNSFIRQSHHWLSMAFTLTVLANVVAMSQGTPPAFVTYAPLFPLALLLFSGLYLFVLPYRNRK